MIHAIILFGIISIVIIYIALMYRFLGKRDKKQKHISVSSRAIGTVDENDKVNSIKIIGFDEVKDNKR